MKNMDSACLKAQKVKWSRSLKFQGIAFMLITAVCLVGGIILVMNNKGKSLVLDESLRLIEQTGDNVASTLNARSMEIAALARTIGSVAENLPKDEDVFNRTIPKLIDFKGDLNVAGGGVWPEAYSFDPKVERRSFFWGRDSGGTLTYYNDYNQPGPGYHNEEWYVVVRHCPPGTCFWSKSYMDPYSYQPMVTCTTATFDKKIFTGTVTIDLKLEGLNAFTESLREKTGGYIFILDRNNKFITFPDPALVKKIGKDDKGNRTEEFMSASEFAEKEPLFLSISKAVDEMNKDILDRAKKIQDYNYELAKLIDHDSYQINRNESEFIAAVISDPLREETVKTKLYGKSEIENDFILGEKSIVSLFHVPGSYWKGSIQCR